jgi:hypothetical protein
MHGPIRPNQLIAGDSDCKKTNNFQGASIGLENEAVLTWTIYHYHPGKVIARLIMALMAVLAHVFF